MKVKARCGYCLLHRGYKEILRATEDEVLRLKVMRELLRLLGRLLTPEAVPAWVGTERDRLIRRMTGCPDPYKGEKRRANELALKLLPRVERIIEEAEPGDRLREVCRIACLGNIIEYDVPGHSHDIEEALDRLRGERLYVDDTDRFRKLIRPGLRVLLLTDNAGEIAFDKLLVRELRMHGCHVTVAVKGGPCLNDATLEDAEAVGMTQEADRVITTGVDAVGINLSESSEEFREAFHSADVIVSKGMANWETLTEYEAPAPILFLLRAKCEPVADSLGVPLRSNVAKLVDRGWSL
ncbi:hypothetical protein DRO24_04925 [Candidatus Bathyarchaeota archaeon]|nr:MAG: hypothetical protein DRO24_04925 [Candidatus Bathyarchaeota archaeon]